MHLLPNWSRSVQIMTFQYLKALLFSFNYWTGNMICCWFQYFLFFFFFAIAFKLLLQANVTIITTGCWGNSEQKVWMGGMSSHYSNYIGSVHEVCSTMQLSLLAGRIWSNCKVSNIFRRPVTKLSEVFAPVKLPN